MFEIAEQSWLGAIRAARRLPLLHASAAALLFGLTLANAAISRELMSGKMLSPLIGATLVLAIVVAILRSAVVAPLASAVHRLTLLDEARDAIALPLERRQLRFFVWLLLLDLLWLAPMALSIIIGRFGRAMSYVPDSHAAWQKGVIVALAAVMLLALIAGLIVGLRLLLVYPAVATDTPRPARRSLTITRGHVRQLLGITLLVYLPIAVATLVLTRVLRDVHVAAAAVEALGSIVSIGAAAVMGSLLYQRYGGAPATASPWGG